MSAPWILRSVPGPSLQEIYWGAGASSEKNNEAGEDFGAQGLGGVAEEAGGTYSGKEEAQQGLYCSTWKEAVSRWGLVSSPTHNWVRGNSLYLCQEFRMDIRRSFSIERIVNHGNRLPTEVVESSYRCGTLGHSLVLDSAVWVNGWTWRFCRLFSSLNNSDVICD